MLNFALASTHDGTVGFWEGTRKYDETNLGTADDGDLDYLLEESRTHVRGAELGQIFSVKNENGIVTVHQNLQSLLSIQTPVPGVFTAQLKWLRAYADLRTDRIDEINLQMNDLLSFFGGVGMLNSSRRKHTLELLRAVLGQVVRTGYLVKHYCRAPRPIDLSYEVCPIIQTPDHSTFPSGHATEAFAVATVMYILMSRKSDPSLVPSDFCLHDQGQSPVSNFPGIPMPFRIAYRIAVNRTIAGVHFPIDSMAGAVLGFTLANALHAVAKGKTLVSHPRLASGEGFPLMHEDGDFTFKGLRGNLENIAPRKGDSVVESTNIAPTFAKLWSLAEDEWPHKPVKRAGEV